MFVYHELYGFAADDASLTRRVAGAIAAIAALCALLAFAPRHDPTKVVRGMPCSILSEAAIGAALGSPMLLMPTSGAVCRYVATGGSGTAPTLFVIARHDPAVPASIAQDGVPVSGVGDGAVQSANGLYVRYGARSYTFIVVPQAAGDLGPPASELRLAKLANRPMIAQNR